MQIETKGFKELRKKLDRLEDIQQLSQPLRDNAEEFRSYMALYPPKPATSLYVRTLTLGRLWTVGPLQKVWNGLQIDIGNKTPYAHWVQSSILQAWMHKRRWQTELDAINELAQGQARRISEFVNKLLKRSV